MENLSAPQAQAFSDADRAAVYQAIFSRRDVRGQFLPTPVPDDLLARVLMAAHHAPSVGFMQPWNFLLVRSQEVKQRVQGVFAQANAEAARMFPDEKREIYSKLKLQGILEAPINLCITCDRSRSGPVVLGRTHMPTMDLYSSVCAVQNLWLALCIPHHIVPIAYLCIGYVSHFNDKPELEKAGWLPRLPINDLVYFEQWGDADSGQNSGLTAALAEMQVGIQEKGIFPK